MCVMNVLISIGSILNEWADHSTQKRKFRTSVHRVEHVLLQVIGTATIVDRHLSRKQVLKGFLRTVNSK